MLAKFAGKCRRCHQPIAVGDEIDFVRGTGAFHPAGTCQEQAAPPPSPELKAAVEWLAGKVEAGTADGFLVGLHLQYATKQYLSEKQLACVTRAIKREDPGFAVASVPSGRYAVQIDGEWLLVHVWRPRGNPDVQRLYSASRSGERWQRGSRIQDELERDILAAIEKDPVGAAIEFGRRTGSCSKCALELRKNLTRFMAIGPVCLKNYTDDDDRLERLHDARYYLNSVGIDPDGDYDDLGPAHALREKEMCTA